MRRVYQVFGAGLLALYSWAALTGWDASFGSQKSTLPAGARNAGRMAKLPLLERRQVMNWWAVHGHQVVSTIIFSVIGIVIFGVFFAILPKVLPFSLKKEILEDENTALGIVIGAIVLGMAFIIGQAVG